MAERPARTAVRVSRVRLTDSCAAGAARREAVHSGTAPRPDGIPRARAHRRQPDARVRAPSAGREPRLGNKWRWWVRAGVSQERGHEGSSSRPPGTASEGSPPQAPAQGAQESPPRSLGASPLASRCRTRGSTDTWAPTVASCAPPSAPSRGGGFPRGGRPWVAAIWTPDGPRASLGRWWWSGEASWRRRPLN